MADNIDLTGKRVAALIPAAGRGLRMGGMIPKPYLQLGAREILAHTLDVFEVCAAIDEVWIIVAPEHISFCQQTIVERYGYRKVKGVVTGGTTRQESVWNGLQHLGDRVDLVVVHDGVRPFVTEAILRDTLSHAVRYGAAIAAVPVKDTLKRVSEAGDVEATVSRDRLWRVQTPQAFQRSLLQAAFLYAREQGVTVTDEAALLESLGRVVIVVRGIESNIKVTTPDDLLFAENIVRTWR
jgi:2-C-methyl-D-erythritol 4-phosphate cytidylyltransferase